MYRVVRVPPGPGFTQLEAGHVSPLRFAALSVHIMVSSRRRECALLEDVLRRAGPAGTSPALVVQLDVADRVGNALALALGYPRERVLERLGGSPIAVPLERHLGQAAIRRMGGCCLAVRWSVRTQADEAPCVPAATLFSATLVWPMGHLRLFPANLAHRVDAFQAAHRCRQILVPTSPISIHPGGNPHDLLTTARPACRVALP